jgi:hypothetical protein
VNQERKCFGSEGWREGDRLKMKEENEGVFVE